MKEYLKPAFNDVQLECVLIQAWKKASTYIRDHSWYSNVLEIDYQSLRIPDFLREIRDQLNDSEQWKSSPLDLVPAPKMQLWKIEKDRWIPNDRGNLEKMWRPLANVNLRDQVVAIAIMMCLADRVETKLGNPSLNTTLEENRRKVCAYGHRLYCGEYRDDLLKHRWGSVKLYRKYSLDYAKFLDRPQIVVKSIECQIDSEKEEIAVVHSDLSKFYDRIRPEILHKSIRKLKEKSDDEKFFTLAERWLHWEWEPVDKSEALAYAREHDVKNFDTIALPQGLAASGFFANVVMLDFDARLKQAMKNAKYGEFMNDAKTLRLVDGCYYVDDIRLVIRIEKGMNEKDVQHYAVEWLQSILDSSSEIMIVEDEKTKVIIEGRENRFLVPQSNAANRIQDQVSGTIDTIGGSALIKTIEGLFYTQKQFSSSEYTERTKSFRQFAGISDMRDETVARFSAYKYRRTFRSLRPMLDEEPPLNVDNTFPSLNPRLVLTKEQLDEHARVFSLLLINEWITNPSHIRLLRVALDMYPSETFLKEILKLLELGWKRNGSRSTERKVKLYCLAELFKAGAIETAMVSDDDCLPKDVCIQKYHEALKNEASNIFDAYINSSSSSRSKRFPWYLMQQVLLYLFARRENTSKLSGICRIRDKKLFRYKRFITLANGGGRSTTTDLALYLTIAYTGFGNEGSFFHFCGQNMDRGFLSDVHRISPYMANEVWKWAKNQLTEPNEEIVEEARALGIYVDIQDTFNDSIECSLSNLSVLPCNPFHSEVNVLKLAAWLLEKNEEQYINTITPSQIHFKWKRNESNEFGDISDLDILQIKNQATQLFSAPDWCDSNKERMNFQIGLLLRFAIRGTSAFDTSHRFNVKKQHYRYRKSISHWEQQRYTSYQGRTAFGEEWIPLSSFVENLLFQLLRWPGVEKSQSENIIKSLNSYQKKIEDQTKTYPNAIFLEKDASIPYAPKSENWRRGLRIGIVQSIIPSSTDYEKYSTGVELNDSTIRKQLRIHLSSLLKGVEQLLRVREGHLGRGINCGEEEKTNLDLLVFPELAVHPSDLKILIYPFIQKYKCIVLCGLVYHETNRKNERELINSCAWLIPEWNKSSGFQVSRVEQGKANLTSSEQKESSIIGFRPAQWFVNYYWHHSCSKDPLRITASVCYDATDIEAVAQFRSLSDLYIVCALNKDVGTFDRMAEMLHYHMYQGILVVNNGEYGGSSLYMPFHEPYRRQVFHFHGQPQVAIAFAEISPEKLVNRPENDEELYPLGTWKEPPAGVK